MVTSRRSGKADTNGSRIDLRLARVRHLTPAQACGPGPAG